MSFVDWWFKGKSQGPEVKAAVEWSNSHDDYFQRNLLAYRYGSLGNYGQIYRQQPAVRTTVDFLARNIAQLNPKVYERLAQNDRLELPDHPLTKLLRHPSLSVTRFSHIRDLVADLAIYDRAYWLKIRRRGRLVGLGRIRPADIWLEQREGEAPKWRTSRGQIYTRDEIMVMSGYSPDDDEGVSPLETLRRVLAEEWAATTHRESFWRNSARKEATSSGH